MLLFDGGGGGGGGAGAPPPLDRNRRQDEEFGSGTIETIALTQAFDNSLWMAETTALNGNVNEMNSFNPTFIQSDNNNNNNNNNNLSALANHQNQQEQSFTDWWHEYWSRQPFPSGYTQSSITLLACFISTIIFLIVVGNLLVCIAIFTEKSLKPTQNWFIASLAVSDMLLGLVIMPFSLARELMGFWIFGPLWCDIHEALDVLLSTASINTLCLISLDRYWSITQAVSYLKKRTPRRGAFMIAFVWVLSAAVSLPPLFGWKKQSPSIQAPQVVNQTQQKQQPPARKSDSVIGVEGVGGEQWDAATQASARKRRRRHSSRHKQAESLDLEEESQFIPSVINSEQQQQQQQQVAYMLEQQQQLQLQMQQQQLATEYPTCQLSDDVGYVLYSAIGSFYIPCAVMVFTYIKIFLAARSRARRAINKQARNQQTGGAASAKSKWARPSCQNQRGPGGGRSATIAGLTQGRPNKHQLLMSQGESAHLLTGANTNSTKLTMTANGADDDPNGLAIPSHEPKESAPYYRHYRHQGKDKDKESTPSGAQNHDAAMMRGKLVVLERRKSTVGPSTGSNSQAATICQQQPSQAPELHQLTEQTTSTTNQDNHCLATLTTSGAKQALPYSVNMNVSVSCDAVSSGQQQQQQPRKPTIESNDSSLITVMSASMTDLPQVTRFNFAKQQQHHHHHDYHQMGPDAEQQQQQHQEKQKAAQLLRAISRAGHELSEENLVKEIEVSGSDQASDSESFRHGQLSSEVNQKQVEQQQKPSSHSTNETCFMTIEEDSDNFDAQTGRTILMIASTARQSSGSILANKPAQARADMMMTMQPAGGNAGDQNTICTNAACLKGRQRRRSTRHDPSYCDFSMTIDDDDDEEGEEQEEQEDDDEEGEDEEEDEDNDECLDDDDLLTDDCNGYSGSCTLEQYCPNTSACAHCRECAAALTDDDDLVHHANSNQQDSPSTSNCKSSFQDSPQLTGATGEHRNKRKQPGGRCQCHRHQHNHNHNQRQQQRAFSEGEGQSLTGDDNLSSTDYYRSNEDNSSFVGHDVLDATPADHRHRDRHPRDNKRRSIVASAIASMGGGLKGVTGAAGSQQQPTSLDEASATVVGRKKSSIGFHLARFGGSHRPTAAQSGGGLLALAAAQGQQLALDPAQQQHQPTAPRNLKTLRQNFFHKLNQLTAKSAAKQNHQTPTTTTNGGKSSAHSSYGSSYEPSVDYATTSNMPSTNDHYHQETTFGETDAGGGAGDWPTQQAGDRRQSGARSSKLLTIAQQTAARHQMTPILLSDRSQSRLSCQQVRQDSSSSMQASTGNDADDRLIPAQGHQSLEAIADGKCNNVKGINNLDLKHDDNNNNNCDRLALISESDIQDGARGLADGGGQANSRSDGKTTLTLANSNQSNQQSTATSGNSRLGGSSNNNSAGGTSRAYLASDNERHKRKLAKARERRATLILGIIMAAFICSWLPFFTFYVIRALCHVCRDYISPRLEAFIFWLGYCNSAINPIIYTIFNRDFRRAFRKILFKCL